MLPFWIGDELVILIELGINLCPLIYLIIKGVLNLFTLYYYIDRNAL